MELRLQQQTNSYSHTWSIDRRQFSMTLNDQYGLIHISRSRQYSMLYNVVNKDVHNVVNGTR